MASKNKRTKYSNRKPRKTFAKNKVVNRSTPKPELPVFNNNTKSKTFSKLSRNKVFCSYWNADRTLGKNCKLEEDSITQIHPQDIGDCECNGNCDCTGTGGGPQEYCTEWNQANCGSYTDTLGIDCVWCDSLGGNDCFGGCCGQCVSTSWVNAAQWDCGCTPDYNCYNPGDDCMGGPHGGTCDCNLNCVSNNMSGGLFPDTNTCCCEYDFQGNGHFTEGGQCTCDMCYDTSNANCTNWTSDPTWEDTCGGSGTCWCDWCRSTWACMSENILC